MTRSSTGFLDSEQLHPPFRCSSKLNRRMGELRPNQLWAPTSKIPSSLPSGGAERDLRGILAPKPLTPHGWPLRGTAEGDCLFGIRDVESGEGKGYPGLMKSKCGGTAMVLVAMLSLTGCSASDTTDRSYAGGLQSASEKVDSSVNRTKVLVQLIRVFKRSEIIDPSGQEKMYTSGWREKLLSAGYKDSDLVDGSEVVTISDSYASASAPGTTWHENAYMAHVPPNFKGHLVPRERQDNSIPVNERIYARGDVVEIELQATPSGSVIALVTAIRRPFNDWKDCRRDQLVPSGIYLLSPLGPPQGISLTCDGLEAESWNKMSTIYGVYEWRKSPSAAPARPAQRGASNQSNGPS